MSLFMLGLDRLLLVGGSGLGLDDVGKSGAV